MSMATLPASATTRFHVERSTRLSIIQKPEALSTSRYKQYVRLIPHLQSLLILLRVSPLWLISQLFRSLRALARSIAAAAK
ncbi:hypothetical protein OCU04_000213 [Sclerotinia nivalis]|uniref:Uncharacterized protein n=1 Tax=Sclerotinia nivalis TaxID=352851 RepID=A0A9X0DQ36_9HELO|nr:hypothetical protein OCU04_000213 [Sclerotinia nivalis]